MLARTTPIRRGLMVCLLLAAAVLLALAVRTPASGARAGATTVVLGATGQSPAPSCPNLPCLAIGSVTGFQAGTPSADLPFRVPQTGSITAWSITLALPTNKQRHFFNSFFAAPPKARIAILRRVPGTQPPKYKLRRQSPVRVLSRYLGQTVKFRLASPLPVQAGNIVALTVPTWAPAFAINLPGKNVWRASRQASKCRSASDLRRSRPHQALDTTRVYGCRYRGYRLLYTATLAVQR